jgi:hypothetical protein
MLQTQQKTIRKLNDSFIWKTATKKSLAIQLSAPLNNFGKALLLVKDLPVLLSLRIRRKLPFV